MSLRRRTRFWLVSWLSLAVLLSQFAVAAYACPGLSFGPTASVTADHAEMVNAANMANMADMSDCDGMAGSSDVDQPAPTLLCKVHCLKDKQSTNTTNTQPSLDLPSLSQILSFVVGHVDFLQPADQNGLGGFFSDTGPPRGTPPVYLALLVLRN